MKQPWIKSATFDTLWILAPGLLPVVSVIVFPAFFSQQSTGITTAWWIALILLIDVSHVYSTVYKTYFNRFAWSKFSTLFKLTPLICWIVGVMLYSIDSLFFWRCLAYLAVFHFVRQQYGFLRIYSQSTDTPVRASYIHSYTIYATTILPILIWHAQGPKNFNWFTEHDFLYFNSPLLAVFFQILFFASVSLYFITEAYLFYKFRLLNIPRGLLVSGTALSWYAGIVVYNGDLSFTLLNVVAHGIPYMALIWASEKKQDESAHFGVTRYFFRAYGLVFFLGLLFLFAFIEEGVWDALFWREHPSVFSSFYAMKPISHEKLICFFVPLLALPQAVHYVLDGFIWKRDKGS